MWRTISRIFGTAFPSTARARWALAVLAVLLLTGCEYKTIGDIAQKLPTPTLKPGPVQKTSAPIKAVPTSTPRGLKPPAQQQEQGPVYCRLGDLTPAATWEPSGNILAGKLTLVNYSGVACTLRGQPQLGIMDERGIAYDLDVNGPDHGLDQPTWLFQANAVAEVRFRWSNWCGVTPQGSLRVTVALPGQVGPVLYVVVQDPNGKPMLTPPACQDSSGKQVKPSILLVEDLQLLK